MSDISSRMKLRAEIVRMLSKYRINKSHENTDISNDVSFLKSIKDKNFVAKLLFKEIADSKSDEFTNVCSIMALEAIDKDTFENFAIDFLQNENNKDEKKFLIISLIKQKGIYFDYDEIDKYIKNPESVAENGVKDFLLNAINDPEAQIDLVDFYLNIQKNEKLYFLDNISKEKMPDSIACSMTLLLKTNVEKDELEIIKNVLFETNSPFAIEGLEYILKNYKINLKERQKIEDKLKKIKGKYPDFVNNSIIKDSFVFDSYISFIDGNSNFSLILSRKMKDNSIDTILLTISTQQGISACMGFGNIPLSSYTTIKRRLFPDSAPIKINPMAFKALFEHYKNKNKKTNTPLPYELIVWEQLISDIKNINYDVSEFLNSKLDTINLNETKVKKFLLSTTIETWYWEYGQNKAIDKLIETIENNHITDINEINQLVSDCAENSFINNKEFLVEIQDRLLLSAYISHLARLKITSSIAYSMCFKNPYFKLLIVYLIDRSLYEYLIDVYEENIKQNSKNVFKNREKSKFNLKELDKLITDIGAKWT